MLKKRVVVLGGGYAGILAAQRLAGRAPAGTQVHLVSDRAHFTERIRLHERIAGGAPRRIPLHRLLGRSGVEIRVGRVDRIDRQAGEVVLQDGSLPFDLALVALGSRTDWERVPGAAEHAFSACDEDAAEELAAHVAGGDSAQLVVVGGGLTAVEVAAELAERGKAVRLVTAGPLLPDHMPAARGYARRVLRALGADVTEEVRVTAIERDAVHLADGRVIAGSAVWCGGFVPAPIAADSGLASAPSGQLLVDGALRSHSDQRIFAAGDVARVEGQAHLRMACATAMPMGAHAAGAILATLRGREAEPFRFGYLAQCLSLGRRRGLIQTTDAWDRPRTRIVTGRTGAWIKEWLCRFPVHALRWEERLPGLYHWPRPRQAPCAQLPEGLSWR